MFITNFRIERPSDHPSLLQTLVNAYTTALDLATSAWSWVSPYGLATMMYRLNRNLASLYRI